MVATKKTKSDPRHGMFMTRQLSDRLGRRTQTQSMERMSTNRVDGQTSDGHPGLSPPRHTAAGRLYRSKGGGDYVEDSQVIHNPLQSVHTSVRFTVSDQNEGFSNSQEPRMRSSAFTAGSQRGVLRGSTAERGSVRADSMSRGSMRGLAAPDSASRKSARGSMRIVDMGPRQRAANADPADAGFNRKSMNADATDARQRKSTRGSMRGSLRGSTVGVRGSTVGVRGSMAGNRDGRFSRQLSGGSIQSEYNRQISEVDPNERLARQLIVQMKDPDPHMRQGVAIALAEMGEAAARYAPLLRERLEEDDDPRVQRSAAESLMCLGPDGAEALATTLKLNKSPQLVLECLGQMEDDALPYIGMIVDFLKKSEPDLRAHSLRALGLLGEAAEDYAVDIAAYVEDINPDVREACVSALQEVGDAGLDALAMRLEDHNALVRQRATEAFKEMGEQGKKQVAALAERLFDVALAVRDSAAEALTQMGPTGCEQLAMHLNHKEASVRLRIIECFCHCSLYAVESHVDKIASLLSDSEWGIRRAAAKTLGLLSVTKTKAYAPKLGELLLDKRSEVKDAAVKTLLGLEIDGASVLADYLDDNRTRVIALQSLSTMRLVFVKAHLSRIKQCAQSSHQEIAASAIELLGRLAVFMKADPVAVELLEELAQELESSDSAVRLTLLKVLASVGQQAAPHVLSVAKLLKDKDTATRSGAVLCLGQMGSATEKFLPQMEKMLLDGIPEVRAATIRAFGALGPLSLRYAWSIIRKITSHSEQHDPSDQVREAAAWYFGQHDDATAKFAPQLVTVMIEDPADEVADEAVRSIRNIGMAGISALVIKLEDANPAVRVKITKALGSLGTAASAATDAIARRLDDADNAVQDAAVEALGKLGQAAARHGTALAERMVRGDSRKRRNTLRALGNIGSLTGFTAAEKIAEQLDFEDDLSVRIEAAEALSNLGDAAEPFLHKLGDLISHPVTELRLAVLTSLAVLGSVASRLADQVVSKIDDDVYEVQRAVVRCLLEFGDAGTAALISRVGDPSAFVRQAVLMALFETETDTHAYARQFASKMADESMPVRMYAVKNLLKLGEVGAEAIAPLLEDPNPHSRNDAVETLGKFEEKAAAHALDLAYRLQDPFAYVRRAAIVALRLTGTLGIETLVNSLKVEEPDPIVLCNAADGLSIFGERAAGYVNQILDSIIGCDDEEARIALANALIDTGKPGRDTLATLLTSNFSVLRALAAQVLGDAGDDASDQADHIASRLNDRSLWVREKATEALAKIGAAGAAAAGARLEDSDDEMRRGAALALEFMGDLGEPYANKIALLLNDDNADVQDQASMALIGMGQKGGDAMIAHVTHKNVQVRKTIVANLGELEEHAAKHTDVVIESLQDDDPIVRRAAVVSLGKMLVSEQDFPGNREHAVEALVSCVDDSDAWVRKLAIESLGQVGDEAGAFAADVLKRRLEGDDKSGGMLEAWAWGSGAASLNQIGSAAGPHTKSLAKRLTSEDKTVRWSAVVAMGKLGSAAVPYTDAVAKLLHDPDAGIRAQAALVLGGLGEAAAPHVDALAQCMADTDVQTKVEAAYALGHIGPAAVRYSSQIVALLEDSDAQIRCAAAEALLELGPEAGAPFAAQLAARLSDLNVRVRLSAVKCLMSFGEDGGNAFAGRLCDGNPAVRRCAVESLGAMGKYGCAHANEVAGLLADCVYVRQAVILALQNLGSSGMIALTVRLDDNNRLIRQRAAEVVGEISLTSTKHATVLADALNATDDATRQKAIEGVIKMSDAAVSQLLALRDNEANFKAVSLGMAANSIHDDGFMRSPSTLSKLGMHVAGKAVNVIRVSHMQSKKDINNAARYAKRLVDPDASVRDAAAQMLGYLGPAAHPHASSLADACNDEDPAVRASAVQALGLIGTLSAEHISLIATLVEDASAVVQQKAAGVWWAIHLASLCENPNASVRANAVNNIGHLGAVAAPYAGMLAKLLEDHDLSVRHAAAEALGQIGTAADPYAERVSRYFEEETFHNKRGPGEDAQKGDMSLAGADAISPTALWLDLAESPRKAHDAATKVIENKEMEADQQARTLAVSKSSLEADVKTKLETDAKLNTNSKPKEVEHTEPEVKVQTNAETTKIEEMIRPEAAAKETEKRATSEEEAKAHIKTGSGSAATEATEPKLDAEPEVKVDAKPKVAEKTGAIAQLDAGEQAKIVEKAQDFKTDAETREGGGKAMPHATTENDEEKASAAENTTTQAEARTFVAVEASKAKLFTLKVVLIGAKNLRDADWVGKSDPYAIATIDNRDCTHTTKVCNETLSPIWNESCDFHNIQEQDVLRIQFLDGDPAKKADKLGQVVETCARFIPDGFEGDLKVLDSQTKEETTFQVKIVADRQPGPVVPQCLDSVSASAAKDTLELETDSKIKDNTEPMAVEKADANALSNADVKASTVEIEANSKADVESTENVEKAIPSAAPIKVEEKAQPEVGIATASEASKPRRYTLKIVLIGAKNLRDADWVGGLSDPYAIASIDNHGSTHTTKVCKESLSPNWNESCEFCDVQEEDVFRIQLLDDDSFKRHNAKKADKLGQVVEKCARFIPNGFEGDLKIQDTGTKNEATFQVKIVAEGNLSQ